jgi:hypothetical protein
MKTIRGLMIPVVVVLAFLALTATGARGQRFQSTLFSGNFTLPFEAQWGAMTLPAGEYSLRYGRLNDGGVYMVAIVGEAQRSSHGWVLIKGIDPASATKNALVCIRQGNKGIVRALELPAIGKSVSFALPRGAELLVHQRNHNTNTQLTEVRIPLERVRAK